MGSRRRRSYVCGGKRRYRSKREALGAARKVARGSTREKLPHRAYECLRCSGWHLTSQEAR